MIPDLRRFHIPRECIRYTDMVAGKKRWIMSPLACMIARYHIEGFPNNIILEPTEGELDIPYYSSKPYGNNT